MGRLKRAGLWEQANHYREEVRQRLRAEGKSKEEAVEAAWAAMAEKSLPLAEQAKPAFGRACLAATEARLAPEPLAPIDLDANYSEKDLLRATVDSIAWAATERRRLMVPSDTGGYKVDYSRASTKPPTAMAMDMVEYYVAYPEKLDQLYQRLLKLLSKPPEEPTVEEKRPKTQQELADEAYLRSHGFLPPEETP
jgi:hypothetical protein